ASSTEHYWTVHMPGHRYCACCDVRCGSLYIYNLHMASKRHMKTTTAKENETGSNAWYAVTVDNNTIEFQPSFSGWNRSSEGEYLNNCFNPSHAGQYEYSQVEVNGNVYTELANSNPGYRNLLKDDNDFGGSGQGVVAMETDRRVVVGGMGDMALEEDEPLCRIVNCFSLAGKQDDKFH
ncbi:hypothetical protein MAR_029949, partial [Mya arenaria]